jgi:hypothetical protein
MTGLRASTTRLLVSAFTLVPALVVASCSSGPTSGVLTGVAWPCIGPVSIATTHMPIEVTAYRGHTLAAHAEITGGNTYRFVLPAAFYTVMNAYPLGVNNANVQAGRVTAVVKAGHTTQLHIYDLCR